MPIQFIFQDDHVVIAKPLSHDAIALARRRTWRGLILRAAVRGLRLLKFDAVLLLAVVIALIRAVAVVSSVRVACFSGVRWCRLAVLIVVVGCGGVVVAGHGAGGPAGAVEGLATSFAAAAGC